MNVRTQPNIGTQTSSTGLAAFLLPGAAPGTLLSLIGTNEGADQYIQLWDASAKSDTSAVMVTSFPIPAAKAFSLDTPVQFTRGIYLRAATVSSNTQAEFAADTNLGASVRWLTRHV